jgi:hypothetical protein
MTPQILKAKWGDWQIYYFLYISDSI